MRAFSLLLPLLVFALQAAGDKDGLAARRLYYNDNSPEVVFKVKTVSRKPPVAGAPATSQTLQRDKIQQELRAATTTGVKPAANLGVRYNVLKVDVVTGRKTEVPPDTVFHEKECAKVRIQPNRGGFLYVFNEGSSGTWNALIPSPEAAADSNIVPPYGAIDIPDNYCFQMDQQAGIERLLIVVTDKPEDVLTLNEARTNSGLLQAFNLQRRDLKIVRVGNQPAAGESPYTTYQINGSATTSDSLVLKVELKHAK